MANRDFVLIYVNGVRIEVEGADAFLMLSDFLRYRRGLTGTKIVCAEGDCGACTILIARRRDRFRAVNSCILPVFLADGSHIVTVEGLREDGRLNELQEKMCDFQGAQCGFCTPGIVMALTAMFETKSSVNAKDVKNHLTGNLCRCTGYVPVIQAACAVDTNRLNRIRGRFSDKKINLDLERHAKLPIHIQHADRIFFSPLTARAAAKFKSQHKSAKVFSAATDLGVQLNKGTLTPTVCIGLNQIRDLYEIKRDGRRISVGAKVTLALLEKFTSKHVPELEQFLRVFASPQIKNVATLAGNVVNGSPIGDTLPFLRVTDATIEIQGSRKTRRAPFSEFYLDYRKTDLKPDEIVTAVSFDVPRPDEILRLYKVAARKDLDISCVNAAFRLRMKRGLIEQARLALGGVGPTVLALPKTEMFLKGRALDTATINEAADLLTREIAPRSDVRGNAAYRLALSRNLFKKFASETDGAG